ncbi:hypothetical protein BDV12DRAFT_196325 [Aspergillus spectabilis]
MNEESLRKRALLALPLLPLFICPWLIKEASAALVHPYLYSFADAGQWTSPRGDILDLTESRVHIRPLDQLINPILAVFAPTISGYDELGRLQILSFLIDIGPFFVILMLEKCRQGHHWTALLYPFAFALCSQITGAGKIAGIFFFIDYLWAPISSFPTIASTAIPKSAAVSLPAAMLLVYYPLTLGSYFAPTLALRAYINAYWQLFPFLVVTAHLGLKLFTRTSTNKPQTAKYKSKAKSSLRLTTKPNPYPRPELHILISAITLLSILSALTFQYTRFSLPPSASLLDIFLPTTPSSSPLDEFTLLVRRMIQYDEIVWVMAGYYWLLLSFRDLNRGLGREGLALWKVVVALVGGTIGVGPGATFGLAWVWRERGWVVFSHKQ